MMLQKSGEPDSAGDEELHVGPWGTLSAFRMSLVNPDNAMTDTADRLLPPTWFFEGFSEKQLSNFIESCNLIPPERTALLNKDTWKISPEGCTITPPPAAIWFLGPDARTKIYGELAKSTRNYAQQHPYRFPYNGFESGLAASGLSSPSLAKIKRLSYREGGYVCFADLQTAKQALTGAEFTNMVETLYQLPTYQLKLRMNSDADFEALMAYWGRGGRSNVIRPVLKSFARVPDGPPLNISYVLPSFARVRLYTYPVSWPDSIEAQQDCFFTAANFFNETADTNLLNRSALDRTFATDYVEVKEAPTYGDVLMLFDASKKPIHAAVYIAGDFVFTKNGVNPSQPWVLMKMEDMLHAYYPNGTSANLTILRHKNAG